MFYNVPKNDPLVQSRLREWRCTNITGDLTGNGWNLGSGWVIRPKALEDIGGFPGTSLIEDVYSTFLMQAQGLDTIYLTESLQFGLVPTSYLAHVNQFTRWVSRIHNLFLAYSDLEPPQVHRWCADILPFQRIFRQQENEEHALPDQDDGVSRRDLGSP